MANVTIKLLFYNFYELEYPRFPPMKESQQVIPHPSAASRPLDGLEDVSDTRLAGETAARGFRWSCGNAGSAQSTIQKVFILGY